MPAQIFISYRSVDGMDKATALARDLGAVFGPEQVFLDKDDLSGGSAWRDEVQRAIEQQPVLLLLMTPQLLGATSASGALRIAEPDDPVRREVSAALGAGARLIPLLCDGLDTPPDATQLPAPFNRIGELTWRRLRAYDWAADVQRIVRDLVSAGVTPAKALDAPAASPPTPSANPSPAAPAGTPSMPRTSLPPPSTRRHTLWLGLSGAALALLAVGWLWNSTQRTSGRPRDAAATPGAGPVADDVSGDWATRWVRNETLSLHLEQTGETVTLASTPVPIGAREDWAAYRRSWRERTGTELGSVAYRGVGTVGRLAGLPLAIDIALRVVALPAEETIDSGNLSASLSGDGRRLVGKLWLNSEQAEHSVELTRDR